MEKLSIDDSSIILPGLRQKYQRDLNDLVPGSVVDGIVNLQLLQEILCEADIVETDRFGLHWNGKRKARHLAFSPSTATLRPIKGESLNWDSTKNIVIEGDNLEVLKLLQKSYSGRVKMIYIDPPYNTGNDFVYSDNFQDNLKNYFEVTGQAQAGVRASTNLEAGGRFHTAWLNMIYPRLLLARDLLRRDGVIFISIDDSEVAHLRVICDEIFGSENFCGVIKRRASRKTAFLSKRMTDMCDYVVAYVRSELAAPLSAGQVSDGTRPVFNDGNAISTRILRAGATAKCPDGIYPAGKHAARSLSFELQDELRIVGGKVERDVRISGPWRINQDVLDKTMFVTRNFGLRRVMLPEELDQAKLLNDLLDDPTCYNEKGSEEITSIFGASVFSYPKPRGLVDYLCTAAGVKGDDIVLDFFAGSGTTGHSVLAQNSADGEKRRFILVQLPELLDPNESAQKIGAQFCDKAGKPRNIAELTKERLRRVITPLQSEGESENSIHGFRVFRLDTSNIRAWVPDSSNIQKSLFDYQNNIRSGRIADDILYELLIRFGLDFCVPIESREIAQLQVNAVGAGALFVCLASTIENDKVECLASGLASWKTELAPACDPVVVFVDNAFKNDVVKANLTAILNQNGLINIRCI